MRQRFKPEFSVPVIRQKFSFPTGLGLKIVVLLLAYCGTRRSKITSSVHQTFDVHPCLLQYFIAREDTGVSFSNGLASPQQPHSFPTGLREKTLQSYRCMIAGPVGGMSLGQ
jgi:hypothetical protein